ncbi:MAG: Carbonic anhydrase 2 [Myxococcota bacterium]|nr:Carbonic anhydrase 2 [Myxococcota bacterium]
MENYRRIMANNREWVKKIVESDPGYFDKLSKGQQPTFLFIGCSDSRAPAEVITGTEPGEMFVHRNIANQVQPADLNVLSVLQYGVEVLDIKHVIVCGHYGCGGVRAAMAEPFHGLVDYWIGGIRNIIRLNRHALEGMGGDEERFKRIVELNVLEQVYNLSQTPVVQQAWDKGPRPLLHGVVYDLHSGLLQELVVGLDSNKKAQEFFTPQLRMSLHGA